MLRPLGGLREIKNIIESLSGGKPWRNSSVGKAPWRKMPQHTLLGEMSKLVSLGHPHKSPSQCYGAGKVTSSPPALWEGTAAAEMGGLLTRVHGGLQASA